MRRQPPAVVPSQRLLDLRFDYFRDRLGFDCQVFGEPPNVATANRDDDTILLALAERAEQIVSNGQIVDKMWDAYIRVDDVDAIYAEVKLRRASIDYTIYNAPHGFRERARKICGGLSVEPSPLQDAVDELFAGADVAA